jgi:hypothetical protein
VIVPGDAAVTNAAYRDAQQLIQQASQDGSYTGRSRQQAEQVLAVFFKSLGWAVEIRWEQ